MAPVYVVSGLFVHKHGIPSRVLGQALGLGDLVVCSLIQPSSLMTGTPACLQHTLASVHSAGVRVFSKWEV